MPVAGSLVDSDLRQRHVDALFTARWIGRDAYVYVLLEHQGSPDPLMALRTCSTISVAPRTRCCGRVR